MEAEARGHGVRSPAHGARPGRSRDLESAEARAKWPDILKALDEEHLYQQRLLGLLEKQVAALNQRRQPDYEVMHGVMRYMTNFPDRYHHPKEDLVFNKVVERAPSARTQVEDLLKQHVEIIARGAELLAVIDRCRADPAKADTQALRKSAHAYIGCLRRHMDVETLRFFPRAQRVLRPRDWAEVDARMKPILDPVFGEQVASEFQTLRTHADHKPAAGSRRPGRHGWVEAAAAMESVAALLGGATKAGASLSRYQRRVMAANAVIAHDLLRTKAFGPRITLARKGCARNRRMARDAIQQVREIWSAAFRAARRPYRQEGTYAASLTTALGKLARLVRRPPVTAPSAAK